LLNLELTLFFRHHDSCLKLRLLSIDVMEEVSSFIRPLEEVAK
jgi:hypothetical protein